MHVHRGMLAAAGATLVLALAGCGGDDEGGGESSGDSATPSAETTSAAAAPSLDAVLACLKKAGLDAKDQSSNTGGDVIGIDYPGGRLGVNFEESPEDAETYGSLAETNGETAVVKGSVVITVPPDAGAQTAQPAVEGCVDAPA